MNLLITGGSGFVGQALLRYLASNSIPYKSAVRNLLSESRGAHDVVVGTIDETTDWSSALKDVDVVVHLAARAHLMKDVAFDPTVEYRRVNTEGTLNLARQAVDAGVRRFIFISSVKVYGESTTDTSPYLEQSLCLPEDPYGISKKEAEGRLKELSKQSGMEVVIIQPPLLYGAGVKANFLNLIKMADTPLPLPFQAIHNHRSMVYLGNLVDFIAHCLGHPAAANQTFLVSDNDDLSLAKLITLIRRHLGRQSRLFSVSPFTFRFLGTLTCKSGVIDRLVGDLRVDCSRARTLLGWQPPYSVEQGIADTINGYLKSKNLNGKQ